MAAITVDPQHFEDGQQLVLGGVGWDQYVAVNDAFPDRPGLRMIYIDQTLTILTPPRRYHWFFDRLDAIVQAVASAREIRWEIAGRATLRLEAAEVGVEGGRTYYFGRNADVMRGPIEIDLATQPPPDLAIEVEGVHPLDDAVGAYARLGVPEVWRFDIRRKALAFLLLGKDGVYHPAARSRGLPPLGHDDILEQLRLDEGVGSTTQWLAQLNDWVRATILPRMVEG